MQNICLNGLNKQTAPTELIKYENTAVVQDIIHFLKNEMFVEKMIINKAKPHRGELFIEMI